MADLVRVAVGNDVLDLWLDGFPLECLPLGPGTYEIPSGETMIVEFTIPGIPQQQGSKRYVGNGLGIDANKKLGPWRKDAIACAIDARPEQGWTFMEPVIVHAVFYFPRPKSHYRTGKNAHELRPSAPWYHSSAPDLDKLARALGDVLTQSALIKDDRLIACWSIAKVYGDPKVTIRLNELTFNPSIIPSTGATP